jgi:predicted house-cleaning noncanonical NTP pyrophosphatase (MazG superfamily)
MKYNKLVRDKIPEIIAASGMDVTFRILNDEEYKIELEKKLDEEVAEFHESKSIEELADILEVITALCSAHGFKRREVEEKKEEKGAARGGFFKGMYLIEVEDDERRN